MYRLSMSVLLLMLVCVADAADCVVLLHGLARTTKSMDRMHDALVNDGFDVVNVGYPSRKHPIEELVPIAVNSGISACREIDGLEGIHFVTHSLGGILVRHYLAANEIPELGRVVMLGPPNQGSAAVDKLADVPGFDWLNGPAGRQLGKGENSVPLALGPADFDVGIIAGSRSIDPITASVLDLPNDGRVTVEETKLDGMADFIIVDHSHAFMMRMRKTIELTIRFLRSGSFSARKEQSDSSEMDCDSDYAAIKATEMIEIEIGLAIYKNFAVQKLSEDDLSQAEAESLDRWQTILGNRTRPVDRQDLIILESADMSLSDASVWDRADDRKCAPQDKVISLYCALYFGSVDTIGEYQHRRTVMQEVRFAIEDATAQRKFNHRLMDFNNLPETSFEDIKGVIKTARDRVQDRLELQAKCAL